jgi:ABC-type dipeptide/oligopeptide/nickel transport system permease subunit
MLLTFISGLAGLVVPAAANWFAMPADVVLSYMTDTVDRLASLPWAGGVVAFGIPELVLSYVALVFVGLFLWRKTGHNFRNDNLVE